MNGSTHIFVRQTDRATPTIAAILAAVALAVGCGRDRFVYRWNTQVLATAALTDRGKLDRAEGRYQALLNTAPDRQARREVLNKLAGISETRGDWQQALTRYRRVWKAAVGDETGGHALYHTALITFEKLGDRQAGLARFKQTITRYPRSVSAEFSTRKLAGAYAAGDEFDTLEHTFETLLRQVGQTPVADDLLFVLGRTLEVDAGDENAALDVYRRVYQQHSDGGLADDARWQSAAIYRARQQWAPAIRLLTRLADDVEHSWFIGNYNSQWANDARFELGLIHMLYLDEYDTAIDQFNTYLDDFPTSLDADDAAWNIVQIRRLAGDRRGYRKGLADFVSDYPKSRHARIGRRRLAHLSRRGNGP